MKKRYFTLLLFISSNILFAQELRYDRQTVVPNKSVYSLNPVMPSPALVGEVAFEHTECVPQDAIDMMQKQINANVAMLRSKNPDACRKTSMIHPLFIWPTRSKASFNDYGYYTVQNLVDHNLLYPGVLLDYNCGNRTYDWQTGNHAGTDIILWPYAWRRMDEQVMEVVAAAPGVIVNKVDGNYDRNCANNGGGIWNAIHVQHDDGSVAWYLHFKSGSLTAKNVGDSVVTGEYLGTAGSSGSSDWPHLHFQVMDASNNVIDPWDGPCNSMNAGDTWWQAPQPYNVPMVNRICTKNSQLDYYSCPNPEITYERDTFNIGDSLWIWAYTRDMVQNSTMQINIYNPSNINVINFSFTVPWATWPTSYVRWTYGTVDAWWTQGWWNFEIVYNGTTYNHMFYMTHTALGVSENGLNNINVFPNPSKDEVLIRGLKLGSDYTIFVHDVLGKLVLNKQILAAGDTYNITTYGLANGVYTLSINGVSNRQSYKLVVKRD